MLFTGSEVCPSPEFNYKNEDDWADFPEYYCRFKLLDFDEVDKTIEQIFQNHDSKLFVYKKMQCNGQKT